MSRVEFPVEFLFLDVLKSEKLEGAFEKGSLGIFLYYKSIE